MRSEEEEEEGDDVGTRRIQSQNKIQLTPFSLQLTPFSHKDTELLSITYHWSW